MLFERGTVIDYITIAVIVGTGLLLGLISSISQIRSDIARLNRKLDRIAEKRRS